MVKYQLIVVVLILIAGQRCRHRWMRRRKQGIDPGVRNGPSPRFPSSSLAQIHCLNAPKKTYLLDNIGRAFVFLLALDDFDPIVALTQDKWRLHSPKKCVPSVKGTTIHDACAAGSTGQRSLTSEKCVFI
jgi:hypothetical protein